MTTLRFGIKTRGTDLGKGNVKFQVRDKSKYNKFWRLGHSFVVTYSAFSYDILFINLNFPSIFLNFKLISVAF